jgi:alpha-glucoside transport system substrate-binding protein
MRKINLELNSEEKMKSFWKIVAVFLLATLVLTACATPAAPETPAAPAEPAAPEEPMAPAWCMGAASGDTISMLYQWSGQEEERLNQILKPLVDECGIVLQPESTRDQALLDTRVQAGNPPDVAFWNVTQILQYQDNLKDIGELGASEDAYIPGAIDPGVIDGKWLGLPIKSDIKTIIWYSPVNFEAAGYTVPTTWEELEALVEKMVADGNIPWSMGMESGDATGWTGSDFLQDIFLVKQGPEYVMNLINGTVPYNDAGVKEAYEIYGKWAMDPLYTVGGAEGTLSTGFNDAILKVFSDPPEAYMVKQSGFAGGTVTTQYPNLVFGTDYDFFVIPGAQGLQGGSDWMMAFSDKPAVKALVSYLASPEGGAAWAAAGFDLSPNKAAAGNYTDVALIKKADAFYSAEGFTPDIGDSIPGGFGSAEFTAVSDFVNGGDLDAILTEVAAVQAEALAE